MTNNQATLDKLDQMRLHGMARALRTSLETQAQWTADELLAHLVDAEWDERVLERSVVTPTVPPTEPTPATDPGGGMHRRLAGSAPLGVRVGLIAAP